MQSAAGGFKALDAFEKHRYPDTGQRLPAPKRHSPRRTITCAKCGRAIDIAACLAPPPPPKGHGHAPFRRRKSTIRNFRSSRLARSTRHSAASAGQSGPIGCRPKYVHVAVLTAAPSSTPRSTVIGPGPCPARTASSGAVHGVVVGDRQHLDAGGGGLFHQRRRRGYWPSDAVQWVCRSARTAPCLEPPLWFAGYNADDRRDRRCHRGQNRSAPGRIRSRKPVFLQFCR